MREIGQLFLPFLPLLAIIVLANMGEGHRLFRQLTLALLAGINLLLVGGGSLVTLTALLVRAGLLPAPPDAGLLLAAPLAGLLLAATGVVASLPLLPPMRRALARRLPIEPENTVHLTALVFAIYLVGATAQQFLAGPAAFEGLQLSAAALWIQAAIFVIFGLLGVGLGLRRDLRETLARLGIGPLTWRRLALALGVTVALLLFDAVVTLGWRTVDPMGFAALDEVMGGLFAGLLSPLGAATLGLSAGIGEELLFRGAVQPRFGLLLATLLFTVGHAQYSLTPALAEVFIIGLVLGLIRRRENTTTAIVVHALYNAVGVLLHPALWQ